MIKLQIVLSIILCLNISIAFGSAKAILVRGKVLAQDDQKKIIPVKIGTRLAEGTLVQTGERSFVKLELKDKSVISLGPKSQIVISKLPDQDPGIVNLIKGQLRSEVNPGEDNKTKRNKLFIKTKSASLGVRGTDFQVLYSPQKNTTSLLTFEGEVQLVKINPEDNQIRSVNDLNQIHGNSANIVNVPANFTSIVIPEANQPSQPFKISPAQFKILQRNKEMIQDKSEPIQTEGESPLPPNVDAKTFANNNEETQTSVSTESVTTPPEGLYDEQTGKFAPASGGYIDLENGTYIAPPPGSVYDSKNKVYVPPPSFGSFDKKTGTYIQKNEAQTNNQTNLINFNNNNFSMTTFRKNDGSIELINPTNVTSISGTPSVDPLANIPKSTTTTTTNNNTPTDSIINKDEFRDNVNNTIDDTTYSSSDKATLKVILIKGSN